MKIKLLHDSNVRFCAGTALDVSEDEAKRLMALNNAAPAEAEAPAEKQTKAKKAIKKD